MDAPSYDHLWRTVWGDMQRLGPVHRHTLEQVVQTVLALNVRTVLDVGCGSGEVLAALARLNRHDLTGTDLSEEALSLAKGRVPTARLIPLNIERTALPEQFDLVMSIQVVEHLLDDIAAIRNMAGMARSFVFISTVQGPMYPSDLTIGHVRSYSKVELRQKMELAGLEVLRMWGWGFPFYSPIYRSLSELLPGGAPSGSVGPVGRAIATALYHLYRLNWPGKGDVLNALARPAR